MSEQLHMSIPQDIQDIMKEAANKEYGCDTCGKYPCVCTADGDYRKDLIFAHKRAMVLANLVGACGHESPEVTGTILGNVRRKVEEIIKDLLKAEDEVGELTKRVEAQHEELRRVAEFANCMANPIDYEDDTVYLKHLKAASRVI